MATEILTHAEASRLVQLEEKIEGSIDTFLKVGSALLEIQEKRLYRSQHSTFEAYCEDRWQMSGRRGRQLATAAKITECLEIGTRVPISEVQVRPLSQVPEEARSEVWKEAVADAGDKPPTMKQVQAVVDRKLGKPKGQSLVDGVLQDDPPDVARDRKKGLIPADAVPEISTVNKDSATAEEAIESHTEAAAERSAIKADQSDDAWVRSLPLYSKLSGVQQNTFVDDALRYRFLERVIDAAKKKSSESMTKFRRLGPFGNRVRRFFCMDPPEKWLLCPPTEEGGCGGSGTIPTIGNCPKCRTYGFWVLG